jgi:serine/threonine protein kinase
MQTSQSHAVFASTFASLTPSNIQAKIAFNEVYEYFRIHGEAPPYFAVAEHQVYNREVFLYRLRGGSLGGSDGYASDTPTDPDTDVEDNDLEPLGLLWTGQFIFSLKNIPNRPALGWMVGRGRQDIAADIQLTINKPHYDVRGLHAKFNLHASTGYLWIGRASGTPGLELTVNGEDVPLGQRFALNQTPMNIRLGRCEYVFEYTDFARSSAFQRDQRDYLGTYLNVPANNISFALTPTPNPKARTFGEWTLGISLGKGTFGKVFAATNAASEIVAVKIVERAKRSQESVAEEIRVLKELKTLGETANDNGRLVKLKEVIYQNGEEEYTSKRFEDVALILTPAVGGDFSLLVEKAARQHLRSGGFSSALSEQAVQLFYDALQGVHFLHTHFWMHGDIKPANIGIDGNKAVLLDLGSAIQLNPGLKVQATPGQGGTIWYLAPERELRPYDHAVDMWAMGIIGYELLFGYHPWKFKYNPWRRGPAYEPLRTEFQNKYQEAMERLRNCDNPRKSSSKRGIDDQLTNTSVASLLIQLFRHPWALVNNHPRITSAMALQHPCWSGAEDAEGGASDLRAKRMRSQ